MTENRYELVVGLETHVELKTRTKAFCGCENRYGAPPNTLVCPVCMGLPGTLPVLNRRAMELAALAGFALNCRVNPISSFDRKNFFYPDLPKAYQITQFFYPLCEAGFVEILADGGTKRIGITRIHVEEDAGKLLHDRPGVTAIDLNRCGVPLIEIVTEPDFRTAEEASAYLKKLRAILTAAGVSDCRMNEGSLRCDVNLSLRRPGQPMGTRTEMKNLNSFKAIAHAIEGERERQIELLEMGKSVTQETRRWDDNKESSHAMRSKEDAKDYRYFPDPDLPPIHISDEWIAKIRTELPEFREEKAARYQSEFGLPEYDSQILTESRHLAALFEDVATLSGNPKKAANWFMVEVLRLMKEKGIEAEKLRFTPQHLADLLTMVDKKEVSPQNAKKVFEKVFDEDVDPIAYVEEHGLKIVEDTGLLSSTISRILDENPGPLSELLGGKEKVMGFFVGQIMKEMKGKANPASVREALLAEVEKRK